MTFTLRKANYLSPIKILVFLGVFILLLLGKLGGIILLTGCILYTFLGVDACIKSLTFSYMVYLANPVLFSSPSADSIVSLLRFLLVFQVFAIAIYTYIKQERKSISKLNIFFYLFLTVVLGLTIQFSQEKSISILKELSFYAGVMGIFLSYKFSRKSLNYWVSWFFSLFIVIVISSILVYPFGSIVYARIEERGNLYQGILNHPQTFSVYLSSFIAFIIFTLGKKLKNKWFYLIILAIAFLEIFLSRGRTGLVALLIGSTLGIIIYYLSMPNSIGKFLGILKKTRIIISIFFGLLIIAINSGNIQSFVMKRGEANLTEAFETSRLDQILRVSQNISKYKWEGIGFGLPSNVKAVEGRIKRDPIFGLPVSVPTEKGFLPVAIVEEIGITGTIFFMLFFISLLKKIGQMDLPVIALILSAIFANIGESFFFSFGGMGLYMWLLTGMIFIKR